MRGARPACAFACFAAKAGHENASFRIHLTASALRAVGGIRRIFRQSILIIGRRVRRTIRESSRNQGSDPGGFSLETTILFLLPCRPSWKK